MTLIRNLFFLFSMTVLALASTAISIFNTNPFTASAWQFVNFYASLLIALAGVLTCIVFYVKTKVTKSKDESSHFWPSLRMGIILSFFATSMLYLKSVGILDWWIAISAVIVAFFLEAFFLTKEK